MISQAHLDTLAEMIHVRRDVLIPAWDALVNYSYVSREDKEHAAKMRYDHCDELEALLAAMAVLEP